MDTESTSRSKETEDRTMDDEMNLQNSNNPSRTLVSESNYLSWSRLMIIALTTKDKLGFITRETEKP